MSMDRFGEINDGDCFVTIAILEGKIKGFLYFVPWGDDRISLDRMLREKNVDPGLTELMIVGTVEFARENRITHISLKDRKSTRLNSSHSQQSRMPSSA